MVLIGFTLVKIRARIDYTTNIFIAAQRVGCSFAHGVGRRVACSFPGDVPGESSVRVVAVPATPAFDHCASHPAAGVAEPATDPRRRTPLTVSIRPVDRPPFQCSHDSTVSPSRLRLPPVLDPRAPPLLPYDRRTQPLILQIDDPPTQPDPRERRHAEAILELPRLRAQRPRPEAIPPRPITNLRQAGDDALVVDRDLRRQRATARRSSRPSLLRVPEVCVALKDCRYVGAGFEDRGYRLGAFDCGRACVVGGEGESDAAVEAAE